MKRFFAALLTLTCMLSLSACREEQAAAKPVINYTCSDAD